MHTIGSAKNKFDLTAFQLIGDQYDGVFFVYDLDDRKFIYLNEAFEPVWKRRVDEVMEHPASLLDSIHPEDRDHVVKNYEKLQAERLKLRMQFRVVWPYTTDRWIRLKVYPLAQNGQTSWVAGMAEDDSSRMKNIFNMQKINARKDSMLEILSHDLRGPIGIVQGLAAAIEEDLPKSDVSQSQRHLQIIQQICQRNIDLIRDLVHQEFLESSEVELSRERLDLVWEINKVIAQYRNAQESLSKVFELTSSQEQVYCKIDSMKFMQVINNLISNAIKFTPDGGIIRIHVEKKRSEVLITVRDNGIGIPEKHHPYLFDKFTEARRPGLKGEESVGLGRSIIKNIVEMHKGKIWFKSEVNKGSSFFIQLPI
ncbi:PAS domain-containing sensor histidine kinase [Pontibacter silvestris]|uniref:PAS domain-containing sensor histidine kinase n=1 Tax=Pontibacter silvestris TaxID=2305183 RepID=UPI001E3F272E|nr:PAS domain-containing sensor histidine kinase [Pontibacter silvestris]MCC9136990.1 PAS domain-containing protein [Pontibacter silvestris]